MIRYLSHQVYRRIIKPIVFRRPPDDVHERLLGLGMIVQGLFLLRLFMKYGWAYRNTAYLSQEVAGITFTNPIGLSAGFDKNFQLVGLMKSVGFGFMEGGSLTYEPCDGNPRPWFYRLPHTKSLVVHAGLANQGAGKIVSRIQDYRPGTFKGFPLNISVAKTNSMHASTDQEAIMDYVGSVRLIAETNVGSMVTLNISCPNTHGGEPFTTPDRLDRLLTEIDKIGLAKPLFIKMPIDLPWAGFEPLLQVIARHTVTGVTVGNLAKDRSMVDPADELPDSVQGGLSGKPTFAASNDLIRRTYESYGKRFVIIGVGGVFNADDAYTKIKLGASLVELITGMIFEGPQLIGQINKDLVCLLRADGYTNISQAVGKDIS